MVGKVEAGIPEDDPRNPATIADNVGDNVGDCAGMAADLFETYAVTTVATMVLASIYFAGAQKAALMLFPLTIAATCIVTSIIGTMFVRLGKGGSIMGALYKGIIATGVLSLIALWPLTDWIVGLHTVLTTSTGATYTGLQLFECGTAGLVITGLIIWITEYYTGTGYRPVKVIAQASVTGHGTNVIQGLAISMESTALPALVICVGIIVTYKLAGLFGIAIAVSTMLSLAGMVVALDAFGPVTDNAGGIAEMAGLEGDVRKTTDALDAVGNTTKAVTKGYAIGSAGLGALVLFAAYNAALKFIIADAASHVSILAGVPQFLARRSLRRRRAIARRSATVSVRRDRHDGVGRATTSWWRSPRQFRERPGIMKGRDKPDYGRAVDMLTRAAIREMIVPSLLPVFADRRLFRHLILSRRRRAGQRRAFSALGSNLLHVIVTGTCSRNIDHIRSRRLRQCGGKHRRREYGGRGGRPQSNRDRGYSRRSLQDTAGPAVNPMIRSPTWPAAAASCWRT